MPQPRRPDTEQRPWPNDVVELGASALAAVAHAQKSESRVPEWIHLSPAGPVVRGRDGREFAIDDPESIIGGTELPMQLDWDHESLSWFGSTKAAAWIDRIEYLEEGDETRPAPGFWGHVEEWTPEGRDDVEKRRFRGISPAVRHQYREPAVEGEAPPPPLLIGFVNAALTNRPNLRMTLLNRSGGSERHEAPPAQERPPMKEDLEKLRRRLGMHESATDAEVLRAALSKFDTLVPKSDLEQALHRATAAEASLKALADAQHQASATKAIEEARKAGKIAPASVPHYEKMCSTPEGLQAFAALVDTLPAIVAPEVHGSIGTPPGVTGAVLTPAQRAIAHKMGISEQEYLDALKDD